MTWKVLCEKHAYRWLADESPATHGAFQLGPSSRAVYKFQPASKSPKRSLDSLLPGPSSSAPNLTTPEMGGDSAHPKTKKMRPKTTSYRSHFKQKYQIEAAWRKGGEAVYKHITPDQGVVTSLHLTSKYIVVALDNAKIHVFNTNGDHQKTLQGHVMGVWAMFPWDDILVSGGCDRDVRVWNMATGYVSNLDLRNFLTETFTARASTLYEVTHLPFDVSKWPMRTQQSRDRETQL